jgi:hypothetical protein
MRPLSTERDQNASGQNVLFTVWMPLTAILAQDSGAIQEVCNNIFEMRNVCQISRFRRLRCMWGNIEAAVWVRHKIALQPIKKRIL